MHTAAIFKENLHQDSDKVECESRRFVTEWSQSIAIYCALQSY